MDAQTPFQTHNNLVFQWASLQRRSLSSLITPAQRTFEAVRAARKHLPERTCGTAWCCHHLSYADDGVWRSTVAETRHTADQRRLKSGIASLSCQCKGMWGSHGNTFKSTHNLVVKVQRKLVYLIYIYIKKHVSIHNLRKEQLATFIMHKQNAWPRIRTAYTQTHIHSELGVGGLCTMATTSCLMYLCAFINRHTKQWYVQKSSQKRPGCSADGQMGANRQTQHFLKFSRSPCLDILLERSSVFFYFFGIEGHIICCCWLGVGWVGVCFGGCLGAYGTNLALMLHNPSIQTHTHVWSERAWMHSSTNRQAILRGGRSPNELIQLACCWICDANHVVLHWWRAIMQIQVFLHTKWRGINVGEDAKRGCDVMQVRQTRSGGDKAPDKTNRDERWRLGASNYPSQFHSDV